MAEDIILIVPIAFDLARNNYGEIIPGPGTRLACDQAIELAQGLTKGVALFFSATTAGPEWEHVVMGRVMEAYTSYYAPWLRTHFHEAPFFSTLGEVIALAEYVQKLQKERMNVIGVVFTVKDWHAPRVEQLARAVFQWKQLDVPISVETHPLPVSSMIRFQEPFKTWKDLCEVWLLNKKLVVIKPS